MVTQLLCLDALSSPGSTSDRQITHVSPTASSKQGRGDAGLLTMGIDVVSSRQRQSTLVVLKEVRQRSLHNLHKRRDPELDTSVTAMGLVQSQDDRALLDSWSSYSPRLIVSKKTLGEPSSQKGDLETIGGY